MGHCCEASTANENKTFFTCETKQDPTIDESGNNKSMKSAPIKKPVPMLPSQPTKSNSEAFQKKFDNAYGKLKFQ